LRSKQDYDEIKERRAYIQGWCHAFRFRTPAERAVAFAYHASGMREESKLMREERRREVLSEIEDALPLDDPYVANELRDGIVAFHERVLDRIWADHQSEFDITRCAECGRILKSPLAKQCLWCGHDWHKSLPVATNDGEQSDAPKSPIGREFES
jgi:hypothetical protein